MTQTYKIRRTGGTCVITLPERIMRDASLKEGDMVRIDLSESNLITVRRANQDLEAARKRKYCGTCGCEVNEVDRDAGYCTNCSNSFNN